MSWSIRNIVVIAALLRGLYGLRPLGAGLLHNLGLEGWLGYPAFITASVAARPLPLFLFGVAILVGYLAIAWGTWFRKSWVGWLAIFIFLVDQGYWISRAFNNQYYAEHAAAETETLINPEIIDWALVGLEMLVFAGALYLFVTSRTMRR